MNQPLLSFTPSALPKETLERLFVARAPLLERLELAVAQLSDGALHHTLLVGPRGIGKTHLLSMLYHRAKVAHADVAVAWLREDPWGLRSYEQFVDQLTAAIAREDGLPSPERTINRPDAEEGLREALRGRALLVLVENLVDVMQRIGRDGQLALRALVQNSGRVVIIATSPSLGDDLTRQAAPFFGFFETVRLEELSLDEARQLLVNVAQVRGEQDLVEFLHTDTATRRLKVVEALAGGHPRVWMLLAGCMSIETIDELVPVFMKALDDLTPYYQDRMRELAQQQESIVFELCELRLPLTVGEIAKRVGLQQNAASVQIRELVDKGYLRKVETTGGDRRKSYYELREPLMRICLDVKASRGEPLRIIVEFLRDWYGVELLSLRLAVPERFALAHAHIQKAIQAWISETESDAGTALVDQLAAGGHLSELERIASGDTSTSFRGRVRAAVVMGQFQIAERLFEALGMDVDFSAVHRKGAELEDRIQVLVEDGALTQTLLSLAFGTSCTSAVTLVAVAGADSEVVLSALAELTQALAWCLTEDESARLLSRLRALAYGHPSWTPWMVLLEAAATLQSVGGDALTHVPTEFRGPLSSVLGLSTDERDEARLKVDATRWAYSEDGSEGSGV